MLVYLDTLIGFSVVMLLVSLLITILTQMVSALVNHRGSNLRWGLKTLFEHIDPALFPQLAANANRLAHEVLTHPLISDSWFSSLEAVRRLLQIPVVKTVLGRIELASAIRPVELTNILRQLAASSAQPGLLKDLAAADWAALQGEITRLLEAPSPAAEREMAQAVHVADAAITAIKGQAGFPLLVDSVNAIRGKAGQLEAWFSSMMDRVAQKFATYMRLWTILFASVFALATGLNSIVLLDDLYDNSSLRNSLAGAASQAIATAGPVLDKGNTLEAALTAALKQAAQDAVAAGAPQSKEIKTTAEGTAWIQANVPAGQRAAALGSFDAASAAASQKVRQDAADNAAKTSAAASQAGFDILKFRWPAKPDAKYFLGVLITAALLSLGAPFWFNALKSLANLRPILATKEKAEQK
jgi:hypothetical protein